MKKQIEGYDNYFIYDNGDVENINTHKILQGSYNLQGYKYYRLSKDNKKKMYFAHRLVAEYFIPNPDSLPVVNHKDGNKINNDISNLEWVTYSENSFHAYANNLVKPNSSPDYYEENLEGEIWKKYLDFNNYLISNKGRIRNVNTNKLLKPSLTCGYYKVRLCKNGEIFDFAVHKLVYAIFREEEYLRGREFLIDHIDGNKTNNCIENLKKVTNQENAMAALYIQKTNKTIKPVAQYTKDGTFLAEFPSASEAARQLNLDSSTITKVCRGVNKSHGGYVFKYI